MHRRAALIKAVTALREAQGGGPGRTAQLELLRGSGLVVLFMAGKQPFGVLCQILT